MEIEIRHKDTLVIIEDGCYLLIESTMQSSYITWDKLSDRCIRLIEGFTGNLTKLQTADLVENITHEIIKTGSTYRPYPAAHSA